MTTYSEQVVATVQRILPAMRLGVKAGVNTELTPIETAHLIMYINAIEQVLKKRDDAWVSTADSLPVDRKGEPVNGIILVQTKLDNVYTGRLVRLSAKYNTYQWNVCTGGGVVYYHGDSFDFITHWQALPEAKE